MTLPKPRTTVLEVLRLQTSAALMEIHRQAEALSQSALTGRASSVINLIPSLLQSTMGLASRVELLNELQGST